MTWLRRAWAWLSNLHWLENRLRQAERDLRDARRALVVAADRHRADLAALHSAHQAEVDQRDRRITQLNTECADWQAEWHRLRADTDRRLVKELALSGAAWQRVAVIGQLADDPDMPPHLAEQIRTAADRVRQIKGEQQ